MKKVINIFVFFSTFLAFGVSLGVSSDNDEAICNAMRGMQVQEEKKIPYKLSDEFELTGLTVDCKKKALIIERKVIENSPLNFEDEIKINEIKKWKNANCKNIIFNTKNGWSAIQITKDINKNVLLKAEANFEVCSQ